MTMPQQTYTREQVSQIDSKARTVFIIDNVVYDATAFLDEHPGGHEVLVNVAGKDASEDFDDVGHSIDAKELMQKYVIGEVAAADCVETNKRQVAWDDNKSDAADGGFLSSWKFPLLLGVLVTVLYSYLFG